MDAPLALTPTLSQRERGKEKSERVEKV